MKNKNKAQIILIVLFSFSLISCGYKKVIQSNESLIHINKINVQSGNKKLMYLVKNEIMLISKENAKNKIDIQLKLNKNKIGKIKDKSGKITRYTIELQAEISFKKTDNPKVISRSFSESNDYDIADNHFSTINRENTVTKNLVEGLSEDITRYLILYFKN